MDMYSLLCPNKILTYFVQKSGDLVYPLPFGKEFFASEFSSEVADLKNSVRSRMNASSSCAAYFVYAHVENVAKDWIHIDLAGPSFVKERGTGFGVHLLAKMALNYEGTLAQ